MSLLFAALLAPPLAAPGLGTLPDPVRIDAFPYAIAHRTVGAASDVIDAYSCAPATDESGPEVVFAFTLPAPAKVSAWVEGDGGGVDIDVHLLETLALTDGVAAACAARGHVIAETELGAGAHALVVDTYAGEAQAGDFVLHVEAIGELWIERPLAEGVVWRARRFATAAWGPQVVHALGVDLDAPGVELRALDAAGCQTVGALGASAGALAGVNGGYFTSGCAPTSLLVADGVLVGTNSSTRGAFGLTADAAPLVEIIAAGASWPGVTQAHGGGPLLVVDGASTDASAWSAENITSASFIGNNPRTFAGVAADGRVWLGTVDGRRANAAGLGLAELADYARAELELVDAVNLDGGGSTTLWIAGATPNGVVNYPSDDPGQETSAHGGSRACSGGFFVFAPPFNHPPRFQTAPVLAATALTPYVYDVDAIDLDVEDVVTFSLVAGPAGLVIDAASGELGFTPAADAPAAVEVIVLASDGHGGETQQAWMLSIAGTLADDSVPADDDGAPTGGDAPGPADASGDLDGGDALTYGDASAGGGAGGANGGSGGTTGVGGALTRGEAEVAGANGGGDTDGWEVGNGGCASARPGVASIGLLAAAAGAGWRARRRRARF